MTDKQPEALSALRDRLRSFEADHTPDGWPAVRMRDITALLDDLDNARSDNHVLRLGYAAARLEIESLKARPAEEPQPSPAAQGDALSDDAVRVPLDSLHADAAYLIGRLREGSMPYARVIEIIRERIDAAKAAIRARAEQGDALDAACQRACMELPEGMSMAIQLERNAGWIELHDSDGEQIELPNADGSLAEQMHEAVNAARAAQEGKKP